MHSTSVEGISLSEEEVNAEEDAEEEGSGVNFEEGSTDFVCASCSLASVWMRLNRVRRCSMCACDMLKRRMRMRTMAEV